MPLINRVGGGGADVSGVTAMASDVLYGKIIVGADGEPVEGTLKKKDITVQKSGNNEHTITAGENEVYSQIVLQKTYYATNVIPIGQTLELNYVEYQPRDLHIWIEIKSASTTVGSSEYILGLRATYYPSSGWSIYKVTTMENDGTLHMYESDFNSYLNIVYDATNKKITLTLADSYSWVAYVTADMWWRVSYA